MIGFKKQYIKEQIKIIKRGNKNDE